MTEQESLSSEHPYDLIYHPSCRSVRKRRLLSCACTRRVIGFLTDERFDCIVTECERYADDEAGWKDVLAARKVSRTLESELRSSGSWEHSFNAARAVHSVTEKEFVNFKMAMENCQYSFGAQSRSDFMGGCIREAIYQATLARDISGNPFRPVTFDPSWRTEAVVGLARGMYDGRDFAPMPVLADALEDAGCADPDVLAHCRAPGPHVRGCWVVDRLLGKG